MKTSAVLRAAVFAVAAVAAGSALAAGPSAGDYQAAYAKAVKLEKQALNAECAWTVTEDALKAAKAAAAKHDYATAVRQAKHAHELAELSLKQAAEQRTAWKNAVVK